MTLRERFNLAINAGLVSKNCCFRSATNKYGKNLRNPGDCEGDDDLLQGLAIAEADIGMGPGWIPQVQKIGCKIADLTG